MLRLNNISIRNKLILMQVFTSVVVLGVFFAVFIVTDVRYYKERRVKSTIGMAQVIGNNSISTLQFQDEDAARNILRELRDVAPDIVHAGIVDSSGHMFANYIRAGADSAYKPPTLVSNKSIFADDRLFVVTDIMDNGTPVGKVYLDVEMVELRQILSSRYELAGILLLVALGFAFIIAFTTQAYFSKRIIRLANTMKEVSKTGVYEKSITDNGKDEISVLVKVFNNLMQEVKENQKRKDEFISIASHELRTPLTSVKGYIELATMVDKKEDIQQCVQKALGGIHKLENLIRDLLDVSKIQSGQLELNHQEFVIDKLIDETIASFQMISKTHRITRKDKLENAVVVADRQRIEQVLLNLLSNAIKYSPGEKEVVVDCIKSDSELVVMISDTGIGVPTEEQPNIFERFYRKKGLDMHIAGFGLGLYISRDIITRHKGRIWMESRDKGSVFCFSLPVTNGIDGIESHDMSAAHKVRSDGNGQWTDAGKQS